METNDAPPDVVKQSNVNVVMCKADKLDLCRRWGLKAILFKITPKEAKQLRGDKAVWAYFIEDEPKTLPVYNLLSRKVEALKNADPTHPSYINLGGRLHKDNGGFLETVNPALLSFDYYPWSQGRDLHFETLEEYRKAALQRQLPLLAWVSTVTSTPEERQGDRTFVPPNNLQRLRYAVYANVAYGAKGIQWFRGGNIWGEGPSYQLNLAGRDISLINAELKVLGPHLISLTSLVVFHAPPIPRGTSRIPEDFWIRLNGDHGLLGIFKGEYGLPYVILMNRDWTKDRDFRLDLSGQVLGVEKLDKSHGGWLSLSVISTGNGSSVLIPVAAGDGELLRIYSKKHLEPNARSDVRSASNLMMIKSASGALPLRSKETAE